MHNVHSARRRPGAHIAVSGVSHRYRRTANLVLEDISFEVQPGEAVALVGRSGCGKSTMLHILSGLMAPSAGTVHIDGARVRAPTPRWIVMFQQPHLYPWMTVRQNVGLGLKFARWRRREIEARVDELLALVELGDYAARNVQDLSGGQQQRVALARSLAVRPDVLLLDEPFSALDAVTRRALQRDVRQIAFEIGITLVVVTHDIAEAVAMADRAIVMRSDPGAIAEIVPIKINRQDRDYRSFDAQAVQSTLQAAFERACAAPERPSRSRHDTLKIVAAGHR